MSSLVHLLLQEVMNLLHLQKVLQTFRPRGTNKMGEGAKNLLNMLQLCSQYTLIFIYLFIFVF